MRHQLLLPDPHPPFCCSDTSLLDDEKQRADLRARLLGCLLGRGPLAARQLLRNLVVYTCSIAGANCLLFRLCQRACGKATQHD